MQKRVLLYVDNSKRDLLAVRLIESALQKKGIKTKLFNHMNVKIAFRSFKPHAVISSRGNHDWAQQASHCCLVYVVPSEGGRLTKETMLTAFTGRSYYKLKSVDWLKRCYLWSHKTYNWLLEEGFKRDQLKVVGNLRLEPYKYQTFQRKPFSDKAENFVLGIAFSATSTSTYYGKSHFAKAYLNFHPDLNFPITQEGRNFEDIVWRDHGILRIMMRVLKKYLNETNGKVSLRPSPFEDPREYLFLEKKYPGRVVVQPNQEMVDWLSSIDTMLTCWSTAGLETLLCKIPVISIGGLFDQGHLFNHINPVASGFESFVQFYHQPTTEESLLEAIKSAQNGLLTVSTKSDDEINQLLKNTYDWPYSLDVSDQIAEDIFKDLRGTQDVSSKAWKSFFPLPFEMPNMLARFLYWVKGYKDMIASGAFKSYYGFGRLKNRDVDRLLKRMNKI